MKKFSFLPAAIYALSHEEIQSFGSLDQGTFLNPNCSSIDLETAEECEEVCIGQMVDCIIECAGDSTCASACSRAQIGCVDACPCHSLCYEGCDGCANHICTCRDHKEDFNYQNCLLAAEIKFGDCFIGCDHDADCISACNLAFDYDYEHCPCQSFCPGGCPCEDGWECIETTTPGDIEETTAEFPGTTTPGISTETTTPPVTDETTTTTSTDGTTASPAEKKSLLILNTQRAGNVPYLIDMETGFVHQDLIFSMGAGTEASHSCSTFFQGRHWMFGGGKEKRQISTVEGCSLMRIGNLPYDFDYGTCNTFTLRETISEEVLMCFDTKDQRGCHAWDGEQYRLLPSSNHPHGDSRLANYKGMPFVTGSEGPDNARTEILVHIPDTENGFIWTQVADYPYSDGVISNYAQISTEDSVIILGGYAKTPKGSHRGQLRKSNWGPSDVIAEYKAGVWNQIGTLLQPRYGHCASAYAGKAYVVGGGEGGRYKTEMYTQYQYEEFEGFTQAFINLELENYYYYPELLQVEHKFCTLGNLPSE